METVLIIGCGSRRDRVIKVKNKVDFVDQKVITLDLNPVHKPDIVWDLNRCPWPLNDNSADEIHAYEVLEHLGAQGDAVTFFETFYECWRILKPGGSLAATVPRWDSMWAWGDPSHRRVINEGSLAFLNQAQYDIQVGVTAMSDFRRLWRGDFELVWSTNQGHSFAFVLRAIKVLPS